MSGKAVSAVNAFLTGEVEPRGQSAATSVTAYLTGESKSPRQSFDWGTLEGSSEVIIGKILAGQLLDDLETNLGHSLASGNEQGVDHA
jgi:hypothetical protein